MSFLNPLVLFGLLGIGIPVVIHLLNKVRVKKIRWAAMKYLTTAVQKNQRRLNLEDLLLLALRCLLIILLVLAFARLVTPKPSAGLHSGDGPEVSVIILDNSASMGQSDGATTRMLEGKDAAREIIESFRPGSFCALLLVSDTVNALVPQPSQDFALLKKMVDLTQATQRGSDLLPAIQAAVEALRPFPGQPRQIYVITDSQDSAWRQAGKIREIRDEVGAEIDIRFILLGRQGEPNTAVTKLGYEGSVPAVNQPLRCLVEVSNFAPTPAESIKVTLAVDGDAPSDEAFIDRIEPGDKRSVVLFARFKEPGFHSLTAAIPSDRLPFDNTRSTAVQVLEQTRVLLVEGGTAVRVSDSDGFFLANALVPVRPDQAKNYYLQVTRGTAADLEKPTLPGFDAVFLANVPALSPRAAQALKTYVNDGGGLVVFPGTRLNRAAYNGNAVLQELLPAQWGERVQVPADGPATTLQARGYTHPLTMLWNDPQAGSLGSVRYSAYFPLELPKAPAEENAKAAPVSGAVQVVASYADGTPAIAERRTGKGRVYQFGSSASTGWSTLPLHPAFVPLVQRMVGYITGNEQNDLVLSPGQPFSREVSMEFIGKDFFVMRPEEKASRRIAGKVDFMDKKASVRYSDTELSGTYRLFIGDSPKPELIFSVQTDPTESNLAAAPVDKVAPFLESREPRDRAAADAGKSGGKPALSGWRAAPPKEFWYFFITAALVVALAEMILAHHFSRER